MNCAGDTRTFDCLKRWKDSTKVSDTVSRYRLEIEVVLHEENGVRVTEVAQTEYNAHGGASALVEGEEQSIPAVTIHRPTEQALMELVEGNPLFDQVGIWFDAVFMSARGTYRLRIQTSLKPRRRMNSTTRKPVYMFVAGRTTSPL